MPVLKRKINVSVDSLSCTRGRPPHEIISWIQSVEQKANANGYTDCIVYIQAEDDHENYYKDLHFQAKREETDQEYSERLIRIEESKVRQKEYKLKQFEELKKELGL
jgi:hypothetical protein